MWVAPASRAQNALATAAEGANQLPRRLEHGDQSSPHPESSWKWHSMSQLTTPLKVRTRS